MQVTMKKKRQQTKNKIEEIWWNQDEKTTHDKQTKFDENVE